MCGRRPTRSPNHLTRISQRVLASPRDLLVADRERRRQLKSYSHNSSPGSVLDCQRFISASSAGRTGYATSCTVRFHLLLNARFRLNFPPRWISPSIYQIRPIGSTRRSPSSRLWSLHCVARCARISLTIQLSRRVATRSARYVFAAV